MQKIRTCILFSLMISISMASQTYGQNHKTQFNIGSLKGTVYTNTYFGLKLKIPDTWHAIDEEGKKHMEDSAVQAISEDIGPSTSKKVDHAFKTNTYNLLTLIRAKPELIFNSSFIVGAQRVGSAIKKSDVFLIGLRNFYKMDRTTVHIGEIKSEKINGRLFATMPIIQRAGDININQRFYVDIVKGYALSIILTYKTEYQQENLISLFNSVEFK